MYSLAVLPSAQCVVESQTYYVDLRLIPKSQWRASSVCHIHMLASNKSSQDTFQEANSQNSSKQIHLIRKHLCTIHNLLLVCFRHFSTLAIKTIVITRAFFQITF
jgi:hypothetical protein